MAPAATVTPTKLKKDRSPSFPFIPLGVAIDRLVTFEKKFGRHPTPADKAGLAWGIKEGSSQADQTLAALRSFGLVVYKGTGPKREVSISDDARTYLRAEQESTKETIVKAAALRPRLIRKLWLDWREDRPIDAIALEKLKFEFKFSDSGAPAFLKIYDATVVYAKLSTADKIAESEDGEGEEADDENGGKPEDFHVPPPPPPPRRDTVKVMEGERIAFTEEARPGQYLKLIACGDMDDFLLEALEDFTKRQRKLQRLLNQPAGRAVKPEWTDKTFKAGEQVPGNGINTFVVHHRGHGGDERVEFEGGKLFPSCAECGIDVNYSLA